MSTYLELQNEVKTKLIDTPTAIQTIAPKLVNRALKTLQAHNFMVMEAEQAYVTVLNQRSLGSLPGDFKEFRGEPWMQQFTSAKVRPITVATSREGLLRAIDPDDTGWPHAVLNGMPTTLGVRTLEVYPLPDGLSDYTDGEYRITLPYWRYMVDLSAPGDTNWFTINAEEYIVYKAVAEGFAMDWDEQRSAVWEQKAELERKKVIKIDKMLQVSAMRTMVPHYKGVNSPLLRW